MKFYNTDIENLIAEAIIGNGSVMLNGLIILKVKILPSKIIKDGMIVPPRKIVEVRHNASESITSIVTLIANYYKITEESGIRVYEKWLENVKSVDQKGRENYTINNIGTITFTSLNSTTFVAHRKLLANLNLLAPINNSDVEGSDNSFVNSIKQVINNEDLNLKTAESLNGEQCENYSNQRDLQDGGRGSLQSDEDQDESYDKVWNSRNFWEKTALIFIICSFLAIASAVVIYIRKPKEVAVQENVEKVAHNTTTKTDNNINNNIDNIEDNNRDTIDQTISATNTASVIKSQPEEVKNDYSSRNSLKMGEKVTTVTKIESSKIKYYVIAGVFSKESNADNVVANLKKDGFSPEKIKFEGRAHFYIALSSFNSESLAQKYIDELNMGKDNKKDLWIFKK